MATKAARIAYNDRLITAVHVRPMLWDSFDSEYKNSRKKVVVWEEVDAEIGCDPDGSNALARFKCLRDTFTRKYKKWKAGAPSGSGASDCKNITWPYFKSLMFLKDQVEVGSTRSNVQPTGNKTDATAERLLFGIYNEGTDNEPTSPEGSFLDEPVATPQGSNLTAAANNSSLAVSSQTGSSTAATNHSSSLAVTVPQNSNSTAAINENGSLQPSTSRPQKRKKKTSNQIQIEKLENMLHNDEDEPAIFGQLIAKRMRAFPESLWPGIELDILAALKKYME